MKKPENLIELNNNGVNVLRKVNRIIAKLNRMKKVTPESILGRNLQLRLYDGIKNQISSEDEIRKIESVIGTDDWMIALRETNRSNEFMQKLIRFINNPRKINR